MNELNMEKGFNGGFKQKVMDLVEQNIPAAQANAFSEYVQNSEKLKREYEALEVDIKKLREQYGTLQEESTKELQLRNNKIAELENTIEVRCKREEALAKWDRELVNRELQMDLTICKINLENAQQRENLLKSNFDTVFKPPQMRTEIHRSLGKTVGTYRPEYDSQKCMNVYVKDGEEIQEHIDKETTKKTEE